MSEALIEGETPEDAVLDHYAVLEIHRDASDADIERAYQLARATWAEDSLAAYSVIDDAEAEQMRERVEEAYRVLSDRAARSAYDDALVGDARVSASVEIALQLADGDEDDSPAPDAVSPEIEGFEDPEDLSGGEWDGARLRRARLRRGIAIERIASVTKINPTYLRCIEDEQFDALPAAVYVRGFVTGLARCIGLDPQRVVPTYMERLAKARPERARRQRRRFGRR